MAALDIIGVYFELRFGVDFRFVRQQQIVIGLIRIGSVGTGVHYGFSIPYAACCASEDATIFLMRCCRADQVIDPGVIVDVLLFSSQVQATE